MAVAPIPIPMFFTKERLDTFFMRLFLKCILFPANMNGLFSKIAFLESSVCLCFTAFVTGSSFVFHRLCTSCFLPPEKAKDNKNMYCFSIGLLLLYIPLLPTLILCFFTAFVYPVLYQTAFQLTVKEFYLTVGAQTYVL